MSELQSLALIWLFVVSFFAGLTFIVIGPYEAAIVAFIWGGMGAANIAIAWRWFEQGGGE